MINHNESRRINVLIVKYELNLVGIILTTLIIVYQLNLIEIWLKFHDIFFVISISL